MKIIGGVDAKTTGRPDDWADGPPDYVSCQAHWYMGITGAQWWDIALLILSPRREFKIFRIERDQEVIDSLVEAGREFWFNHVLKQIPPPLDGSAGSSEYLKQTYPRDVQDIIVASPMAESLMMALQGNKQAMKEIEGETAELENRLKEIIGDNAGILGRDWKATWKVTKVRTTVDWEKVAHAFNELHPDLYEKMVREHTTIKQGPRVFRVTALKEGK